MPAVTSEFRTLGPSDAIPDDYVVPYYLDDRKLRVSVATGAVVNGPATEPLGVYEVRELDGEIQARV